MPWSGLAAAGVHALGSALSGGGGMSAGDAFEANVANARYLPKVQVEGAKRAGVHPLYVMGNTPIVQSGYSVGGSKMGDALQAASQHVGRALDAHMSKGERQAQAAYEAITREQQIENNALNNEMLKAQVTQIHKSMQPAMPAPSDRYLVDGQGDGPLIDNRPLERRAVAPERPSQEAGAVADTGFLRTPTGYAPAYSHDAKDRLEDDWLGMATWNIRNRLLPAVGVGHNPPPMDPGPGRVWIYDAIKNEYRSVPRRHDFIPWRNRERK